MFSVPYPKMRKALQFKLPIAMNKQRHPKFLPSKLDWTQRQRAIISDIIDKPSNQAKTPNQLERLVRLCFSFLMILTLHFPDRIIFQERQSLERPIHTNPP
jgi:hypothetical protein